MIVVLGGLLLTAGTIGAVFDNRTRVKTVAWASVYAGIFLILIGLGGITAIRDAIEY